MLTSNNNRTELIPRNLQHRWEARLDQKLSAKNMVYARFSWRGAVQEPAETLPTIPLRNGYRRGSTFILSDAHTFGASLVNEFRFGRQSSPNQVLGSLNGMEVQYTGIQGVSPPGDYRGMPAFTFSGTGAVSNAQSTMHTNDRYHSWTLSDSLTWVRGSHTLRWGFSFVHNGTDGVSVSSGTFGTFAFNGYFTGNSYADFLLGLPERASRATYREWQDRGLNSQYAYFEDAWRINPKITLTLGARYEYQQAGTDSEWLMYNLDPRDMSLVVPDKALNSGKINPLLPAAIRIVGAGEANYPQALRRPDKNNLIPRLGLAIRPLQRTVIRAGYGMFMDDFGFSVMPATGGPLYAFTETFQNTNKRQPQYAFPNPFGASGSPGTATASGFKVDMQNPYIQQWSLTVEREVSDVGVRVSYIGTKGTNLGYTRSVNVPLPSATPFSNSRRPYPQFGNLTLQRRQLHLPLDAGRRRAALRTRPVLPGGLDVGQPAHRRERLPRRPGADHRKPLRPGA